MATEAPLIMTPSYRSHRPSSLLVPPNPAYAPISPRGGILLNPVRMYSPAPSQRSSLYTPRTPASVPTPLRPDSAAADASSSLGSRKIRFAPLPEPRRDEEDGSETPCTATYPADVTSTPVQSPGPVQSVSLDRTDSLVTDSGASTTSTDAETQSQQARKREKRNSLLRLFGLKNGLGSPRRTSTTSLPAADSNGTIGGIPVPGLGLFRSSSRESWGGEFSGYASDNSSLRRLASPLRSEFSSRGSRPTTPVTPNRGSFGAPPMEASGVRGQRMLNGRVYGARRAKERLQPQPSMEPEFSEWGYGGMGSVGTTGEYGKLQSSSSAVGGGDDEDDGSGMTWIKKRRREREERERKAAEEAAAAAEKAAQESAESSTDPNRTSTETSHSTRTIHAEPEIVIEPDTPTRDARSPTPTVSGASQQPSAATIPQSPPRTNIHAMSRSPSRQNSGATVIERHAPTVIAVPAHRSRQEGAAAVSSDVDASAQNSPEGSTSGSSHQSNSSDDEEEVEGSSSTTGRDDDDDDEEDNQKRKTALSAGIEKISRHHAQ